MIIVQRTSGSSPAPTIDFEIGSIILWYGTEADLIAATSDWEIYSSASEVFIMGAESSGSSLVVSGSLTHTHDLSSTTGTEADHTHSISGGTNAASGTTTFYLTATSYSAPASHTHGSSNSTSGAGGTHSHTLTSPSGSASNMPPYYQLYWIKKVA